LQCARSSIAAVLGLAIGAERAGTRRRQPPALVRPRPAGCKRRQRRTSATVGGVRHRRTHRKACEGCMEDRPHRQRESILSGHSTSSAKRRVGMEGMRSRTNRMVACGVTLEMICETARIQMCIAEAWGESREEEGVTASGKRLPQPSRRACRFLFCREDGWGANRSAGAIIARYPQPPPRTRSLRCRRQRSPCVQTALRGRTHHLRRVRHQRRCQRRRPPLAAPAHPS